MSARDETEQSKGRTDPDGRETEDEERHDGPVDWHLLLYDPGVCIICCQITRGEGREEDEQVMKKGGMMTRAINVLLILI